MERVYIIIMMDDRYEGDFKNGLFDGKGIFYCNNGNKYKGELKNGICEGRGILYFKSGSKYDGTI